MRRSTTAVGIPLKKRALVDLHSPQVGREPERIRVTTAEEKTLRIRKLEQRIPWGFQEVRILTEH